MYKYIFNSIPALIIDIINCIIIYTYIYKTNYYIIFYSFLYISYKKTISYQLFFLYFLFLSQMHLHFFHSKNKYLFLSINIKQKAHYGNYCSLINSLYFKFSYWIIQNNSLYCINSEGYSFIFFFNQYIYQQSKLNRF